LLNVGGSEDAAATYAMAPIKIIDPFKHVSLLVSVAELRFAGCRCRGKDKLVEERFYISRSRAPFLILSPFFEDLFDAISSAFLMQEPPFRCTWSDSGEIAYYESVRANRDVPRNLPRDFPPRATGGFAVKRDLKKEGTKIFAG